MNAQQAQRANNGRSRLTRLLLVGSALLFGSSHLLSGPAQEKSLRAPIDGVVVYSKRALVTRRSILRVPKSGTTRVVIADLTRHLVTDSVRASLDGGGLRIVDVGIRTYAVAERDDKVLEMLKQKRKELQQQLNENEDRRQLLRFRRAYLEQVQKSFLETSSKDPRPRKPAEYNSMLEYLSGAIRDNNQDVRKATAELTELKKRAGFLERQIASHRSGRSRARYRKRVTLLVEATGQSSGKLTLSYIVPRAGWKPGYDVRVLEDQNRIEFNGYGLVSQRTGEDWRRAALKLSTARPTVQSRPPVLEPIYVRAGGGPADEPVARSTTKAGGTGQSTGSLVFDVPRRIPVASDGRAHRTTFTRHALPVRFEYIAFPRYSGRAYLLALGKNNMGAPILDGHLNIFQGNDFVGSSRSGSVLPGEDFELALGVNENIRINRRLDELVEDKAGLLGGSRRFRYSFVIEVGNYGGKTSTINVVDQLPVARGTDARIADFSASVKPEYRNKQGILKWKLRLANGKKTTVRFSYTITVPEGKAPNFGGTRSEDSGNLRKLDKLHRERFQDAEKQSPAPALRKQMY